MNPYLRWLSQTPVWWWFFGGIGVGALLRSVHLGTSNDLAAWIGASIWLVCVVGACFLSSQASRTKKP